MSSVYLSWLNLDLEYGCLIKWKNSLYLFMNGQWIPYNVWRDYIGCQYNVVGYVIKGLEELL